MKPEFTELTPAEKSRKYHFGSGVTEIQDVCRIAVSKSGTHRLETADGKKHIVPSGWLRIELEVEDWTF